MAVLQGKKRGGPGGVHPEITRFTQRLIPTDCSGTYEVKSPVLFKWLCLCGHTAERHPLEVLHVRCCHVARSLQISSSHRSGSSSEGATR